MTWSSLCLRASGEDSGVSPSDVGSASNLNSRNIEAGSLALSGGQDSRMTMSRERRDVGGVAADGDGDGDDGGVDTDALAVLADDTALTVLAALDEPRTAQELADDCDLGLSTVYRKLERLTAADLCEERVTVRSDGCRVSRYRRTVEGLHVGLGDGEVTVDPVARETLPGGVDQRVGAPSD